MSAGQEKLARLFYVAGIVQGVGFRFYARRIALSLGVVGYAKNLRDGRVEVYAVGEAGQLEAMRAALRQGPRAASVSEVLEEEAGIEERFAADFLIEHNTR